MDTNAENIGGDSSSGWTQALSPRATRHPTTPLRGALGDEHQALLSPFALFSEEKAQLRAASPVLSFEELARILAEEWDSMPEEAKTPYRQRADEEHLRHETMSAALVLTQVTSVDEMLLLH
ncbi:unnamed protein product [Ectocarpus sp. 12 AP-2014]